MTSMPDPDLKIFRKDVSGGTLSIVLGTKKGRYESGRGYGIMKMFMADDGDTKIHKSAVIPTLKEAKSVAEQWQEEEGGGFELMY